MCFFWPQNKTIPPFFLFAKLDGSFCSLLFFYRKKNVYLRSKEKKQEKKKEKVAQIVFNNKQRMLGTNREKYQTFVKEQKAEHAQRVLDFNQTFQSDLVSYETQFRELLQKLRTVSRCKKCADPWQDKKQLIEQTIALNNRFGFVLSRQLDFGNTDANVLRVAQNQKATKQSFESHIKTLLSNPRETQDQQLDFDAQIAAVENDLWATTRTASAIPTTTTTPSVVVPTNTPIDYTGQDARFDTDTNYLNAFTKSIDMNIELHNAWLDFLTHDVQFKVAMAHSPQDTLVIERLKQSADEAEEQLKERISAFTTLRHEIQTTEKEGGFMVLSDDDRKLDVDYHHPPQALTTSESVVVVPTTDVTQFVQTWFLPQAAKLKTQLQKIAKDLHNIRQVETTRQTVMFQRDDLNRASSNLRSILRSQSLVFVSRFRALQFAYFGILRSLGIASARLVWSVTKLQPKIAFWEQECKSWNHFVLWSTTILERQDWVNDVRKLRLDVAVLSDAPNVMVLRNKLMPNFIQERSQKTDLQVSLDKLRVTVKQQAALLLSPGQTAPLLDSSLPIASQTFASPEEWTSANDAANDTATTVRSDIRALRDALDRLRNLLQTDSDLWTKQKDDDIDTEVKTIERLREVVIANLQTQLQQVANVQTWVRTQPHTLEPYITNIAYGPYVTQVLLCDNNALQAQALFAKYLVLKTNDQGAWVGDQMDVEYVLQSRWDMLSTQAAQTIARENLDGMQDTLGVWFGFPQYRGGPVPVDPNDPDIADTLESELQNPKQILLDIQTSEREFEGFAADDGEDITANIERLEQLSDLTPLVAVFQAKISAPEMQERASNFRTQFLVPQSCAAKFPTKSARYAKCVALDCESQHTSSVCKIHFQSKLCDTLKDKSQQFCQKLKCDDDTKDPKTKSKCDKLETDVDASRAKRKEQLYRALLDIKPLRKRVSKEGQRHLEQEAEQYPELRPIVLLMDRDLRDVDWIQLKDVGPNINQIINTSEALTQYVRLHRDSSQILQTAAKIWREFLTETKTAISQHCDKTGNDWGCLKATTCDENCFP